MQAAQINSRGPKTNDHGPHWWLSSPYNWNNYRSRSGKADPPALLLNMQTNSLNPQRWIISTARTYTGSCGWNVKWHHAVHISKTYLLASLSKNSSVLLVELLKFTMPNWFLWCNVKPGGSCLMYLWDPIIISNSIYGTIFKRTIILNQTRGSNCYPQGFSFLVSVTDETIDVVDRGKGQAPWFIALCILTTLCHPVLETLLVRG